MKCLLPAQLTEVPKSVLETLDPETAARYMVFPISEDRRTVQLAMVDPTDLRAVDEVAFRTGRNVAPVVAPELLVVYALERFYQVKRANRFCRARAPPRVRWPARRRWRPAGTVRRVRTTGPTGARPSRTWSGRTRHHGARGASALLRRTSSESWSS
jgi:hypothetical protein